MCGIAGKLNFDRQPVAESAITRMCGAIIHRGPDDSGVLCDHYVGLGARRLSIIDIAGGHMPMSNEEGSIWIVYNGEIYNFLELRQELIQAGHRFATRTDTEVIIHLYEQYGLDCLQYLNGMFAFAIWDQPRQRLFLARDRLGQKPICYALMPWGLVFGSEIYALLQDPAVPRELDYEAIDLYLALMYVPSPLTIFKAIRKLRPGHYLIWENDQVSIRRYWDIPYGVKRDISEEEAAEELCFLLKDAVRRRLISDVPLGAFLSGGIDSSIVVAVMSGLMSEPVKTFSIGYTSESQNELGYAWQLAQRYQTDHHEFIVEPQLVDILPKLSQHYGEPFGDESAVATYYVSKVARQSVTVALSGDGGDEAFGGYIRCISALHPLELIPGHLRNGLHSFTHNIRRGDVRLMFGALRGTVRGVSSALGELNHPLLAFANRMTFLSNSMRQRLYSNDFQRQLCINGIPWIVRNLSADKKHWDVLDKMFYLDQSIYLPDDILVKVDIASMANSLEVRSPLLDYRVVELSASLPPQMKIRNGETKYIFRRTFGNLLPPEILKREKMGFSIPIDEWIRDDLYPMTLELLTDRSACERGLFNQAWIKEMLERHKNGIGNYARQLWLLLNFEIWYRSVGDRLSVTGMEPE
ncbi:MAG: asparagine synthase (glutamine-hydrolyzing) [Anaerolineae bacterium]|nr:asparagine synthase (glutamine-hydrolyzing) [Anaerolineae bacterium]